MDTATGRPRPGTRRGISELTAAIDRLLGPPPSEPENVEVERFAAHAGAGQRSVRVSFTRTKGQNSSVVVFNQATGERVHFDPNLLEEVRTALDDLAAYLGSR